MGLWAHLRELTTALRGPADLDAFLQLAQAAPRNRSCAAYLASLDVSKEPLDTPHLGVYAAPAYLQRAGTPLHPGELEDSHHHTVGYLRARSGTVALISMQRDAERIEVQGRHVVALDDGNAYLAAGVAGMGVLWLPQYMANDHAARGELVPLFDGWSFDAMPMYVAFPSNRHVSAKLRAFIDWVVELMPVHSPVASRPENSIHDKHCADGTHRDQHAKIPQIQSV